MCRVHKVILYQKKGKDCVAWAVTDADVFEYYVEVLLCFRAWELPWFTVRVMNKTYTGMNPFSCLLRALESETIGMQKYDALKDRVRELRLWQKL